MAFFILSGRRAWYGERASCRRPFKNGWIPSFVKYRFATFYGEKKEADVMLGIARLQIENKEPKNCA